MASSNHTFSLETDASIVKTLMGRYRFLLFFWKISETCYFYKDNTHFLFKKSHQFQIPRFFIKHGDKGFGLSFSTSRNFIFIPILFPSSDF